MKAADIMTTKVINVAPDTTVLDCVKLFLENHISAAPVLDANSKLVGIVSEGDLMLRAEIGTNQVPGSWWLNMYTSRNATAADVYVKTHANRVGDVMTKSVVSVTPDTRLGEVAYLLESKRIKRVPVLDADRVVGVVSRANLLHALASHKESSPPMALSRDDRSIRQAMLTEMKQFTAVNSIPANITVADGVLELWGIAYSEQERTAAQVAAEAIPGVKKVVDHRVLISQLRTPVQFEP